MVLSAALLSMLLVAPPLPIPEGTPQISDPFAQVLLVPWGSDYPKRGQVLWHAQSLTVSGATAILLLETNRVVVLDFGIILPKVEALDVAPHLVEPRPWGEQLKALATERELAPPPPPVPQPPSFDCPLSDFRPRPGAGPRDPSVSWTSLQDIRNDASVNGPCTADSECSSVGLATGCCKGVDIPVLAAREQELRRKLGGCRDPGSACERKCPRSVPSRNVCRGQCVIEPAPDRPQPTLQSAAPPVQPPPPAPLRATIEKVRCDGCSQKDLAAALDSLGPKLNSCTDFAEEAVHSFSLLLPEDGAVEVVPPSWRLSRATWCITMLLRELRLKPAPAPVKRPRPAPDSPMPRAFVDVRFTRGK